jgi:UDP-N-acetylmuramoyl-tripeptide--D-alanyl-D-alanine ligase
MGWDRNEILLATGGRLLQSGPRVRFGEVVTDSNKAKRGSVFVALKGERLDGHRFVGDAVRRGADCVVVHRNPPRSACGAASVVKVRDTLRALGDLAHHRRRTYGPKVLAITGSNGKTTTKEMLAAILEAVSPRKVSGRILKTEGNFNNLVGLPLTLLRLRRRTKVAVVELGTNRPGEIARLAEIAAPDMGIITSVAAAHLEGLNSLAGVAREKGNLFKGIRPGGMIAVNLEDPWVRRLGEKFKGKKITYGKGGDVWAESWRSFGGQGMMLELWVGNRRYRVRLGFLGDHNSRHWNRQA